jgi:hypothetical protein
MSVKLKTKMESTKVCFTEEQISVLDTLLRGKILECVDSIMDSDGEEFEGDRDSFNTLFEKVFTLKDLPVISNDKKVKKKTKLKDPNMPKKFKTAYFVWLWNVDDNIGMSKIKKDFPDLTHKDSLSKAGKIWKDMSDIDKKMFYELSIVDKTRYEEEMIKYLQPIQENGKFKLSLTNKEEEDEELELELEELEGFERKDNLFLYGYTKKTSSTKFDTLTDAVLALEQDEEAMGIVKDNKGHYTLRKGKVYKHTPILKQPDICWKKL